MSKLRETMLREAEEARRAAIARTAPTVVLQPPATATLGPSTFAKPEAGKSTTTLSFGAPQTIVKSLSTPSTLDVPKVPAPFTPPTTTANAAPPNPFAAPSVAIAKPAGESKTTGNVPVPNFFGKQQTSQQGTTTAPTSLKVPTFGFTAGGPSAPSSATANKPSAIFGAAGNGAPSTTTPSAQPKSAFTFGATSTPGASVTTPVFGASSNESKTETEKSSQSAPAGSSLLSRLGLSPAESPTSQPSSAVSANQTGPASTFSFGKLSAPAAAPAASVGEAKSVPASGETSNVTSPPKFNFGFSKPAISATPSAPASTSTPSISTPEAVKTTTSTFSFGASKLSEPSTSASTPSAAPASKNTFAFGSYPNAFGNTTATSSAPADATPKTIAFGAGSGTSNASLFGALSDPATTSSGTAKKPSIFGSSGFASSTTPVSTPTGVNKPSSFVFGAPSSSAPSTTAVPNTAAANTTAGETQHKPTFTFGSSSGATPSPFGSQPSTNTGNASSPFGNPGPSAFGFSNPPSTTSGSSMSNNTNTQNQK
ncbi:hypothetical protein B0H21DRAFT_717205 [Amylocystis lapponica]|nr:hypothetical protein B0H21DRAFT_717205 [Amylocystis lapponica]